MNEKVAEFLNSKGLPILLTLILGCFLVYSMDISITDYIADKVIERMDARYSPYGPAIDESGSMQQPQPKPQPINNSDPWR